MKNKKKKGFTLIELLAIIVILAIIAVITVPIILNIIENSRKGAATDSAYGYKDAVNKWYVSKLQEDNQYQLASSYTISSDGKLGDIVIPVSGDKPSGGYLNYSNNTLIGGCLVFGDYAVTFDSKGNAESTIKGTCSSSSEQGENITETVTPIVYTPTFTGYYHDGFYERDTITRESIVQKEISPSNPIAVGDYVTIGTGDDLNGFYVIGTNSEDTIVYLLSEYYISAINRDVNNVKQDSSEQYEVFPYFTNSIYWEGKIATMSDYEYSCDVSCFTPFKSDGAHAYVYYDKVETTNYLTTRVYQYGHYLKGIYDKIDEVRLMSIEEFDQFELNPGNCIVSPWFGETMNGRFWLGSVDCYTTDPESVFAADFTSCSAEVETTLDDEHDYDSTIGSKLVYKSNGDYSPGLRVVIEIKKCEFTNSCDTQ